MLQKLQTMRGARGLQDLLVARLGPTVADVLPGVGREDHRFLRHQTDSAAKLARIEAAQIDPVEADTPASRVVEAQQ